MTTARVRHAPLALVAVMAAPLLVLYLASGPITQDQAYHRFADARPLLGVPNVLDVASNLPFLLVGLLGLRAARATATARRAWAVLFLGLVLVSLGSGYYHHAPDDARLVWDRLPMTLGFMGLFVALLAESVDARLEVPGLLIAIPLGIGSIVAWRLTGDLRPYIWVQAAPLVAIPLLMALYRPRYTRSWYLLLALGCYALAKVTEVGDQGIFDATGGLVGGHAIKHLLAAAGAWVLVRLLQTREPVPAILLPCSRGLSPRVEQR